MESSESSSNQLLSSADTLSLNIDTFCSEGCNDNTSSSPKTWIRSKSNVHKKGTPTVQLNIGGVLVPFSLQQEEDASEEQKTPPEKYPQESMRSLPEFSSPRDLSTQIEE